MSNTIHDSVLVSLISNLHYWKFRYFMKILALETACSSNNFLLSFYTASWSEKKMHLYISSLALTAFSLPDLTLKEPWNRSKMSDRCKQTPSQKVFLVLLAEFPLRYFAKILCVRCSFLESCHVEIDDVIMVYVYVCKWPLNSTLAAKEFDVSLTTPVGVLRD